MTNPLERYQEAIAGLPEGVDIGNDIIYIDVDGDGVEPVEVPIKKSAAALTKLAATLGVDIESAGAELRSLQRAVDDAINLVGIPEDDFAEENDARNLADEIIRLRGQIEAMKADADPKPADEYAEKCRVLEGAGWTKNILWGSPAIASCLGWSAFIPETFIRRVSLDVVRSLVEECKG